MKRARKTLHGFVMREAAVCGRMKPRQISMKSERGYVLVRRTTGKMWGETFETRAAAKFELDGCSEQEKAELRIARVEIREVPK